MLPILQPGPDDGGTKYGSTLYSSAYDCPKRAKYYFEQYDVKREAQLLSKEYSFGDGDLAIGSYFHKFMELYHKGIIPNEPIQKSDLYLGTEREEALEAYRLASWYMARYSKDFYGEVLNVEMAVKEDHKNFQDVQKALGVPFTFKTDLVVRVDNAALTRLVSAGCSIPGTGIYLVDFKTRGRHDSLALQRYSVDIQALAYPLAYNAVAEANHEEVCKGVIFAEVYKTKTVDIGYFFIPILQDVEQPHFRNLLANSEKLRNLGIPNPHGCFKYNRMCDLMKNNLCKGY